jgi:hypothetical protein
MKKILIILLLAICQSGFSQIDYLNHKASLDICKSKFELAFSRSLYEKPINEVFLSVALSFIGTDYEGFVLEKPINEEVFIYLEGLDCVSLIENSLVLSRLIKKQDFSFNSFLSELEYIRYRDGKKVDYLSRLHYFSEWIENNEKKGILKNVSKELGGKNLLTKNISFMSKNSNLYPKLKSDEDIIRLKEIEERLNRRDVYYIGKEQLTSEKIIKKIDNGDLIALIASDTSLDITHTAIAVKQNGNVHLLHAPKAGMKVQITEKPLYDYISNSKSVKGIMVVRLID